jgi:hypothetical protein
VRSATVHANPGSDAIVPALGSDRVVPKPLVPHTMLRPAMCCPGHNGSRGPHVSSAICGLRILLYSPTMGGVVRTPRSTWRAQEVGVRRIPETYSLQAIAPTDSGNTAYTTSSPTHTASLCRRRDRVDRTRGREARDLARRACRVTSGVGDGVSGLSTRDSRGSGTRESCSACCYLRLALERVGQAQGY